MSETASQTDSSQPEDAIDEEGVLAARRKKLEQVIELGHDPWGHRFDDRSYIENIRQRETEIVYALEDGQSIQLPAPEDWESFDFKACCSLSSA